MNKLKEKWEKYLKEEKPNLFADCFIESKEVQNFWLSQFSEVLSQIEEKIETLTYTPSPQGTLIFKDDVVVLIKSFKNEERE